MDVLMPQMGETVAEGTLTVWHKEVGDVVSSSDILFEIGTDKVEMEVPALIDGILTEIFVQAGETVVVGSILAVIEAKGEKANPLKSHKHNRLRGSNQPLKFLSESHQNVIVR